MKCLVSGTWQVLLPCELYYSMLGILCATIGTSWVCISREEKGSLSGQISGLRQHV